MVIYKITNSINNKVYIGQTIRSLHERWSQHKFLAKNRAQLWHFKIQT